MERKSCQKFGEKIEENRRTRRVRKGYHKTRRDNKVYHNPEVMSLLYIIAI